MIVVEKGVSNFRDFQARGTRFFDRSETLFEAAERRRKRRLILAGILAPFALAIFGFFGVKAWDLTTDVVKIVDEWHQLHHAQFDKKSLLDSGPQVYANSNKTQQSEIPYLFGGR